MMDIVRIHVYYAGHVPADVRAALRTMGGKQRKSHLRRVARGESGYSLIECIVAFVGNRPVGWAAFYITPQFPDKKHVGVWVRTRDRGMGYGKALWDNAFNRWGQQYPMTYGLVETVWDAKYRKEDTSHIAWQDRPN